MIDFCHALPELHQHTSSILADPSLLEHAASASHASVPALDATSLHDLATQAQDTVQFATDKAAAPAFDPPMPPSSATASPAVLSEPKSASLDELTLGQVKQNWGEALKNVASPEKPPVPADATWEAVGQKITHSVENAPAHWEKFVVNNEAKLHSALEATQTWLNQLGPAAQEGAVDFGKKLMGVAKYFAGIR